VPPKTAGRRRQNGYYKQNYLSEEITLKNEVCANPVCHHNTRRAGIASEVLADRSRQWPKNPKTEEIRYVLSLVLNNVRKSQLRTDVGSYSGFIL